MLYHYFLCRVVVIKLNLHSCTLSFKTLFPQFDLVESFRGKDKEEFIKITKRLMGVECEQQVSVK